MLFTRGAGLPLRIYPRGGVRAVEVALEANRGKRNVIDSQAAKQNHGKNNGVEVIDLTTVTIPRLNYPQRSRR